MKKQPLSLLLLVLLLLLIGACTPTKKSNEVTSDESATGEAVTDKAVLDSAELVRQRRYRDSLLIQMGIYLHDQKMDSALLVLDHYEQSLPRTYQAAMCKGIIYYLKGDQPSMHIQFQRALGLLDSLLAIHPNYIEAIDRSHCLLALYGEACFRKSLDSIRINPVYADSVLHYGIDHYVRQTFDEMSKSWLYAVSSAQFRDAAQQKDSVSVFLKNFYEDYVFGDKDFNRDASVYCTKSLLEFLAKMYAVSYDNPTDGPAYAIWWFRTGATDGPSDSSAVLHVEKMYDDWYRVFYSDRGLRGSTMVRVVKEKDRLKFSDIKNKNF